jgi:hypothetical protein
MEKIKEFLVDKDHVGIILRGRSLRFDKITRPREDPIHPEEDPIHTDCILPNGNIIGYAYADNSFYDASGLAQKKLRGLQAKVYVDNEHVQHYWDMERAKKLGMLSTFLLIRVTDKQAESFKNYWDNLRENTPQYNLLPKNCSILCYEAFKAATILTKGILTPVTPSRVYLALIKEHSAAQKINIQTGYFGIIPHEKKITITEIDFQS